MLLLHLTSGANKKLQVCFHLAGIEPLLNNQNLGLAFNLARDYPELESKLVGESLSSQSPVDRSNFDLVRESVHLPFF